MGKWVMVVAILFVAIIVAFSIFVATGVIDGPALFWNVGMKIGWIEPHLQVYSHGQDAEAWIATQQDKLQLIIDDLEQREVALHAGQEQLDQRAQQLDKREADLNSQTARFQGEQAKRRNVQTLAALYTEMGPAEAAPIIEKLEQSLILDVLLNMDMQDAANILVELPTTLAIALSEHLGRTSQ